MSDKIYIEGCLPKVLQWMNSNFVYIGTAIFVIAVIQVNRLAALIFIFCCFSFWGFVLLKIYEVTFLLSAPSGPDDE